MLSVSESWIVIETWMARHAPASGALLGPPAGQAEISAAEAALGLQFPPDLVASLRHHDGMAEWSDAMPGASPLPIAEIVETRGRLIKIAKEAGGLSPARPGQEPWFHENWLPFAETADNRHLVIDLRPGSGHGRLGWAGYPDGGLFGDEDTWPRLGAYLSDVAMALRDGGDVAGEHPFLTPDGELWWDDADATELNGAPLRPAPPLTPVGD